jgi:thioredoxin-dependent peroxiredoxin
MRLLFGQKAPQFDVLDVDGRRITLQDYRGVFLLLSFYRFAGCPICNVRMRELAQKASEYRTNGLHLLACIDSRVERVDQELDRDSYPFPLIAGLGGDLYQKYGVEWSVPRAVRGLLTRAGALFQARNRNVSSWIPHRNVDGRFGRLPADFLIDPGGRILLAYYGQDLGDFLPAAQVDLFLRSRSPLYTAPSLSPLRRSVLGL